MSKFWIIVSLVGILSTASGQVSPGGEVKLPLADFQTLWKELAVARQALVPNTPPVGAVLTSAAMEIKPVEKGLHIRTTFEVKVLDDQWNAIALLPASYAVLATEPADATFANHKGEFSLFTNKTGRQVVIVDAVVNAQGLNNGEPITLAMPNAASVTFQLAANEILLPIVEGGIALGGGKFAIESKADVRLRFAAVQKEKGPEAAPRWKAGREVFAQFAEEQVKMLARVLLQIEENQGWTASLLVPAQSRVTKVTSEDLLESRVERFDEKRNRLLLRWATGNVIQREILIESTLQPPTNGSAWQLDPPLLENEANPTAWFGLVLPADFESTIESSSKDPASGAQPGIWLQRVAKGSLARYVLGSPGITVSIKSPPILATPKVTCLLQKAQSKLVADGALVSEVAWSLKHEPNATLRMKLPEGAVLLSCTCSKQPVQPLLESDGAMRIRLSAKTAETLLEVSYHQKRDQWDPLRGKFRVSLPLAALMVERVEWNVSLPKAYEMEAFEGNVAAVGGTNPYSFQKELCNDEAPFVELFYKKNQ